MASRVSGCSAGHDVTTPIWIWAARSIQSCHASVLLRNRDDLTVRMSSTPLSSLPSYNNLSNLRIQSLYSDISRQKHSNPTTYNSNIAWWRATLEDIVSRGWLPNTPDRLILHAEQNLLETLRYERVGKPLCLGTVIVSRRLTYGTMTCS